MEHESGMIGGMAVEVDWGRVVEHGSGMVGGMVVGVNWGRVFGGPHVSDA